MVLLYAYTEFKTYMQVSNILQHVINCISKPALHCWKRH